jgi:hypothetical protein
MVRPSDRRAAVTLAVWSFSTPVLSITSAHHNRKASEALTIVGPCQPLLRIIIPVRLVPGLLAPREHRLILFHQCGQNSPGQVDAAHSVCGQFAGLASPKSINRTVDLQLGRHLFLNTVPKDSRDRRYPSKHGCLLPVNLPFFLIFFTGTMDAPAEGRYRHS